MINTEYLAEFSQIYQLDIVYKNYMGRNLQVGYLTGLHRLLVRIVIKFNKYLKKNCPRFKWYPR